MIQKTQPCIQKKGKISGKHQQKKTKKKFKPKNPFQTSTASKVRHKTGDLFPKIVQPKGRPNQSWCLCSKVLPSLATTKENIVPN